MKKIDVVTAFLLVLGGLNWGLIGLFDFDLIDYVFSQDWIVRVVYVLVALSAIYKVVNWQTIKARWKVK